MSRIIRADVSPGVLVWAREQAGLNPEDAARKAGVSIERFLSWEEGANKPTLRQARLLAKAYRRPSAFFYLSAPPDAPPELPDFRSFPNKYAEQTSDLLEEVRRARFRREIALEVFRAIDQEIPTFELTASLDESAERVGTRIRGYLDLSEKEQFSWHSSYEALSAWMRAIESSGVLVFQFSGVDVRVVRGFSISELPLPAISLNGKDAPHARIFTLLHELCHLALGTGGLCDLHEEMGGTLESYCNAAAAEALVPASILLRQPEVLDNPYIPKWSDDTLQVLSNRFHVSREVILRRLLTLGKTTPAIYQSRREEFKEEYRRLRSGKQGGFMRYHKRVLRNNGVAYTSLVINAYHQQAITAIDVSRYLGDIRLNHLGSIQHELTR